jgi:signal transduction histidine kinase
LPEQHREEIFKPFFTMTKKAPGHEDKADESAGLGLSLASLLIEDYHGTIACESIPGETTFTIQIPCPVDS